jgi:protein-S-isoprenylcysteine O-methyltransferase Ste14
MDISIVLKTLLFTLLLPGSVTVGITYLLMRSSLGLSCETWRFIGVAPVILGVAVYISTVWDFISSGKGTPAPIDPPKMLVSRRLYRISRNPMYIGVLLVLCGEAIFFASLVLLIYTIVIWFAFHLFVIYYEEPKLERKFGPHYRLYLKTVPRWIPRLKRMRD